MKTPTLTTAAAKLLMDLVERPVGVIITDRMVDVEALGILRARGLADVDVGVNLVRVTPLGNRIAEALYALWRHAQSGDPENGISRTLRGLVAEVAGAVPAEPPRKTPEPAPTKPKKRKR